MPTLRAKLFRVVLQQMMRFQFPQELPIAEQRATMDKSVERFFKLSPGLTTVLVWAGPSCG